MGLVEPARDFRYERNKIPGYKKQETVVITTEFKTMFSKMHDMLCRTSEA